MVLSFPVSLVCDGLRPFGRPRTTPSARFRASASFVRSFYLGGQPESKSKHLALNIVAEAVIVLDSPDAALLCHADVEYLHYHKEISSETGELGANYQIALLHLFEKLSQLPFVIGFCTADSLLDPNR